MPVRLGQEVQDVSRPGRGALAGPILSPAADPVPRRRTTSGPRDSPGVRPRPGNVRRRGHEQLPRRRSGSGTERGLTRPSWVAFGTPGGPRRTGVGAGGSACGDRRAPARSATVRADRPVGVRAAPGPRPAPARPSTRPDRGDPALVATSRLRRSKSAPRSAVAAVRSGRLSRRSLSRRSPSRRLGCAHPTLSIKAPGCQRCARGRLSTPVRIQIATGALSSRTVVAVCMAQPCAHRIRVRNRSRRICG